MAFLDGLKSYGVHKSQLMPCQVCTVNPDRHLMRYVTLQCHSSPCQDLHLHDLCGACDWFLKTSTCQPTQRTVIYQHGANDSAVSSPSHGTLSLQMKDFIRKCADQRMKPNRILNTLIDKFDIQDASELLPKVQNFVGHYKSTKLSDNEFVDDMVRLAASNRFDHGLDDTTPFVFGYETDQQGSPRIGLALEGPPPTYLMCFFHVMQNVRRYCRSLSPAGKQLIYLHIYRVHYARDAEDMASRTNDALWAWGDREECRTVAAHINVQWFTGRFSNWMCFNSPPG